MRYVRYLFLGCSGLCVFLLCTYVWAVADSYITHNAILRELQERFSEIKHPESMLLERVGRVGSFGGHGYCDYGVGEFRSSALTKKDVQKFYDARAMNGLGTGYDDLVLYFQVIFVEDAREASLRTPVSLWFEQSRKKTFDVPMNRTVYFVFVTDGGHSSGEDWRCDF